MSYIITIGRQYGSGGHEIGEKLAQKLNIPFYDNALIDRVAKESGLSKDIINEHDERMSDNEIAANENNNFLDFLFLIIHK